MIESKLPVALVEMRCQAARRQQPESSSSHKGVLITGAGGEEEKKAQRTKGHQECEGSVGGDGSKTLSFKLSGVFLEHVEVCLMLGAEGRLSVFNL